MGPTALLAVTVAMPKAKANCIFEAYINIFAALLCSKGARCARTDKT